MKKFFIIAFFVISAYIFLQNESIVLIYKNYRVETNLFFPTAVIIVVAAFFWTLAQQQCSWMLYWMRRSYRRQMSTQQSQIAVYEFQQELISFLLQQGWDYLVKEALKAQPAISPQELRKKLQEWGDCQSKGDYEKAFFVVSTLSLAIPNAINQRMFIEGFSRQFETVPASLVPEIFDGLRGELKKKPALKNIFLLRLNQLQVDQQKCLLRQVDLINCSAEALSVVSEVILNAPQEWAEWFRNNNLPLQQEVFKKLLSPTF